MSIFIKIIIGLAILFLVAVIIFCIETIVAGEASNDYCDSEFNNYDNY